MAINFPDNPNVNDTHTASGCTWKWDGTSWSIYSSVSTGIGFSDLSVSQQAASGSGSLTYNNAGIFTYTPPAGGGGGGSSTFTGLSDTPSSLTAGKWLKVNTGGTALEWTDAPSGGGVTYALTAGGGSVVTEEKIYLTGSGGTEDAVILAVDANSGLTIERANSKITFGSTVANESTDTECYPLFTTEATGNLAPKTVTSFKLNSSSGQLEAGSFKKTGGTNTEFLKADGSIDSTAYSTTGHTHSYALNDLTNVDAVTGAANGKILKYNGASWELADDLSGGGGSGNFTGLSDTPNSLTAGKWLKVNAGATALEYTDAPSETDTLQTVTARGAISDQPISVGTTATGVIFNVGDSGTSGDKLIQIKRSSTTTDCNIQAVIAGTGAGTLKLNDDGGTVTTGGNVLIGTTIEDSIGTINRNLVVGSTTNNDEVAVTLNVMEGSNGRRAKFFLDDDDGVFGVDSTASTGVPPFVVRIAADEKFRIGSDGQIGIAGANYGTSGQVLTSGGPSAVPSWSDVGGATTLNDLSNVDAVTGVANGKILKYNGTSWEVADDISSGSGSSTFTALTDTPNSYTALRWLRVNSGGNALEWEVLPVSVVNNNADNRLITGSATFGELNCEANLTFDGTKLNLGDDKKITFGDNLRMEIYTDGSNNYIQLPADGGGAFPFTIKSNTIDALKIDSSGNTIIGGNLTVNGTTTTVNSNTVNIGDNILVLNSDETGTPSQAAGIEVERGTSTNVSLRWNESETKWQYTNDGTNFNDITSSAAQVQSDWNATSGLGEILNKPTLFSGSYTDLTNKPTIPAAQVNSDWNATSGNVAFILNKPTLFSGAYNDLTGKPTLFSGNYNDLTNKPTIPAAQIQSDWNQATTSALDYIKNKPTIPTNNTQLTNGAGYISSYTDTNDYVNGLSLSGTTLTASFSNTSLNKTVDLSSLSGGSFSGGMIMMWYGSSGSVPSGWVICDGSNSTPDLRDKFILGANPNSSPSQSSEGGSHDAIVVSHSHGSGNISGNTGNHNGHTHGDGNYNADLAGSHTHQVSLGNQSANHVHTFSHNINTGTQGAHTHSYNTASWDNQSDYLGPYVQGGSNQGTRNTNSGGGHSHNFNITADTLGISANHNHSGNTSPPLTTSEHNHGISGNSGSGGSHSHNVSISGNTGSNGSGGSGANKPKYYAMYYIMKT